MDDREFYPDPKRMKLSDMSPNFGGLQPCICPPPRKGLPQEQSSAAWDGRVENVRAWLKSGGNINAVNQYGGTLLSAACCNGQAEVMRELMLHPDLHLNTVHGGKTALAQAIHYGHNECVEIILTSSLKCRPILTGHWTAVEEVLKRQPALSHDSASYILSCAAQESEWTVVELLLAMNISFTVGDLDPSLQKAFALNEWQIIYSILRRKFRHKGECMNEILAKLIDRRDWEKVDVLLKLEKKYAKFDVMLAEACLEENELRAHQLLKQNKYDAETLNGTLLVVAGGGTSEEVCHLLMDCYHLYTDETLVNAIYLTSMKNNLELLPFLLQKHFQRISYQALSSAHDAAERFGNRNAQKLLERALEVKAVKLFSLE
ncbi:uncharacterized protein [Macrobrachium rosenbergii]|uniref:uncharacterized protein n=1 Tax=Macrobrachium rosenbergii TaxID=79674 RepID=UPI0034D4482D